MKITLKMLESQRACAEGLELFLERYPEGEADLVIKVKERP